MKTNKQTIVEFRFPVTDEVLKSAMLQLQRTPRNEPFYSFVFVSDDDNPKSSIRKAREYFDRLFGASNDVIVQNVSSTEDTDPERSRTVQTIETRVFNGEKDV